MCLQYPNEFDLVQFDGGDNDFDNAETVQEEWKLLQTILFPIYRLAVVYRKQCVEEPTETSFGEECLFERKRH